MVFIDGWRYWFRRYLGWFPLQPCILCRRWYWGGFPWPPGWQASYVEYCSKKCHNDGEGWL